MRVPRNHPKFDRFSINGFRGAPAMSAIATSPPETYLPPSTPLLSALVPQDGFADRFWDIDFLVLPLLHHSLALFADFWVLGGSCIRDTPEFPEGLELATYPYTLRALPADGDCRMLLWCCCESRNACFRFKKFCSVSIAFIMGFTPQTALLQPLQEAL